MTFRIGDRVRMLINISNESEGIIIKVGSSPLGNLLYLVRTPDDNFIWFGKKDLKLVGVTKEKVIFT